MPTTINMNPVTSSNIAAVGFQPGAEGTGTLAVQFSSGTTYHYDDVPNEVAEGLQKADSVGSFFAKHVRSKFAGVAQKAEERDDEPIVTATGQSIDPRTPWPFGSHSKA